MYTIKRYEEIGSTNGELKRLAFLGAPSGTVLIADRQTAGRGRLGRAFFSPAGGGVYMSVLLRPVTLSDAGLITTFAAVAVARVLRAHGVDTGIKWVNDIVSGGKKVCGILVEGGVYDGQPFAVVGIGVNCKDTAFPSELADIATSVASLTGVAPEPATLADEILEALAEIDLANPRDPAALMDEYRSYSVTLGRAVRVYPHADEPYDGTAETINDDGTLAVRRTDGTLVTVSSGEVSIRPLAQ